VSRRARSATGLGLLVVCLAVAIGATLFVPRGPRAARGAPAESSGKAAPATPAKTTTAASGKPAPAAAGQAAAEPSGKPAPAAAGKAAAEVKAAPAADAEDDPKSLPIGKGLPLFVRAAVFFLDVKAIEDTKGEFEATTDLRLRWWDLRQRFPASEEYRGFKEFRFGEADKKLEGMWAPQLEAANRIDSPSFTMRRLRVYPDGQVELLTRTTARYKITIDAERFPFDRQELLLDLVVRETNTDDVQLEEQQDDVDFSRATRELRLTGWTPGLVHLDPSEIAGWSGDRYGRVKAALDVDRNPRSALAPVFIPLVASLLIPLLAIWMNKVEDDAFEVDAFELANVIIGGLFSVIALSFAIYSAYGVIAGGDNTVTRLFGLNYVTLALSLSVVVLFFRFKVPRRLFGPHVQAEMFHFVLWALPVLSTATSVAFILVARG
jgi:hypothetical protein